MTPTDRIVVCHDAPLRPDRDVVLYWMIAARRTSHSFGLQRAVAQARALGKPLLVLEPLRVDYPWASVRHHTTILQGMVDNAAACAAAGVTYLPYVEPEVGHGSGLLAALARRAALIVTDVYPTFFLPGMVAAAASRVDVRMEAVDGLGILPLSAHGRWFSVAHSFRRHLHKTVEPHLGRFPEARPLAGYDLGPAPIPAEVAARWPAADLAGLLAGGLASLPLDGLAAVQTVGGQRAGRATLERFVATRLGRYGEGRNDPGDDVSSGLSPYLHYGQIGAHEVVQAVLDRDGWTADRIAPKPTGQREGWWGASPEVEAFLDEVITWRELGQGFCHHRDDHADYDSLPEWALTSLAKHAPDVRSHLYGLDDLAAGRTHDPLWNAAQHQLVHEGRIHNYLRMLWGKNILGWTRSAPEALDVLLELNNRYAIDGRDPNSLSGIFWTLGRFDRAWGPERPVFGKVRYMTSASTARKVNVRGYVSARTDDRGFARM